MSSATILPSYPLLSVSNQEPLLMVFQWSVEDLGITNDRGAATSWMM